jgi:predicted Zn-dependent protease
MTKKNIKSRGWGFSSSPSSSSISLNEYLKQIDKYIDKKQWSNAKKKLEKLEQHFPENKKVLQYWLTLTSEKGDWNTHQQKAEEFTLKYPDDPDGYLFLSNVLMKNTYPLLALQTLQDFCNKFPDHPHINDFRKDSADIESILPSLLKDLKLQGEEALKIGRLMERSKFLVDSGKLDESRGILENLIKLAPNFCPAFNNLSQILCSEGNLTEAIDLAQKVLEQDPDNFQALGNLVRYYVLSGKTESAKEKLEKLKALKNDDEIVDIWLKKAEALSWFGDYIGLVELGKEAELSEVSKYLNAAFWHWIAVAHCNLGQETKARQLWKKSLAISSDFEYALNNLENCNLTPEQRNTAWAFELRDWIPFQFLKDLLEIVSNNDNNPKKQKSILREINENYPHIISLIPILLRRGSPNARQLALNICSLSESPELISLLKDFASSQEGMDKNRIEVAQYLNQKELIPSGAFKIWLKGEKTEILLMAMELHDKPTVNHSKKVMTMKQRATIALKQGEAKKAESILLEALKLAPSAPDLQFNLAGAYLLQKREKESHELLKEIHQKHPNYAFATLALAKLHLDNQETDKAEELIKPLLMKKEFNYMEYCKLCEVQIELAINKKSLEGANAWLKIWKQIADEDDPSLNYWSNYLDKKSSWLIK